MFVLLLLVFPGVTPQDPAPRSQFAINNYIPETYNAVKFIRPKPTKKGPILFPNDAPPPPPPPLIVTSRPLSESIARSELNPKNSLAAQSQLNQVSYRPNYLARVKDYVPYTVTQAPISSIYGVTPTQVSYGNTERVQGTRDTFYIDYEKKLLETIHRSKHEKEPHWWDYPVRRRRIKQVNRRSNGGQQVKRNRRDKIQTKNGQPVEWRSIQSLENPNYRTENRNEIGRTIKGNAEPSHEDYGYKRKELSENKNARIIKWRGTQSFEDKRPRLKSEENELVNKKRKAVKWEAVRLQNQNRDSAEQIATRAVRPLYEVTEQQHLRPQDSHQTPAHRFKYQTKSHDSYYDVNDNSGEKHDKDYNHGDNYAFSYTVKDQKTGDDFSHSQQSTGSATNGEYRVRLPDGRMQIVSYTADENGYKADVRYDDQHNNDNSIDTSRENGYRPQHYQTKAQNNNQDHFNDRDFSHNRDYTDHRYKTDPLYDFEETSRATRPIVDQHNNEKYRHDDFTDHNDDFHEKSHSLSDSNDDYLDRFQEKNVGDDYKLERTHDNDYINNDDIHASQELADYSSDFDQRYQPHKSKFSVFNQHKPKTGVTPSYEELKDLFVTNVYRRLQNNRAAVSTPIPGYDTTTERVVVIAPKSSNLYTNIHAASPGTPLPLVYSTPQPPFASTPRSYLVSTIANLKSQISLLKKPVLSNQYIDKINKYLSYK